MHYLDMALVFELILEEDEEGTAAIKIKRWNLQNATGEISMEDLLLAAQQYILKTMKFRKWIIYCRMASMTNLSMPINRRYM